MKVIFCPTRFLVFVSILLGFGRALAQTEAVQGVPIFGTPDFAETEGLVGALTRAGALDRAG